VSIPKKHDIVIK